MAQYLHITYSHSLVHFKLFLASLSYLIQCSESESRSVACDSLRPHGLYSPWNSPGQNTKVSSLSFLQGIIPNPGIELRSSTLQADSLPAEPPGKPKNTERVAYSFSSGSSWPRNRTRVSCFAGTFFISWDKRAPLCKQLPVHSKFNFAIWNSKKFFQILSIIIWLYPWVGNLWVRKACTAVPQLLRAW